MNSRKAKKLRKLSADGETLPDGITGHPKRVGSWVVYKIQYWSDGRKAVYKEAKKLYEDTAKAVQ